MILDDISEWSSKLPAWQSDGIRRLLAQADFTDQDKIEILAMLKASAGLVDASQAVPVKPLNPSHLNSAVQSDSRVLIKRLHSLSHVNAIAANQSLDFLENGMTVIYGDNGAGKSGYARVMKKACRARDRSDRVLPNVHEPNPSVAQATFDVSVDGEETAVVWRNDEEGPPVLSRIAVFDSTCARLYVDDENEVLNIPYGLDVFPKLVRLCDGLKAVLQQEARAIDVNLPAFTQLIGGTAVATFLQKLTHTTEPARVHEVAVFSEDDVQRLQTLEKIVLDFKANDPKIKASALRRQKSRIERLRNSLNTFAAMLSDAEIKQLQRLRAENLSAIEAARIAATQAFDSEPLPGVGSDPWKILFAAAKDYSVTHAYPNQSFPVVDEASRCVLCHQPLGVEARERLMRFQAYVVQTATQLAEAKRKQYDDAIKKVETLNFNQRPEDLEVRADLQQINAELAVALDIFLDGAKARRDALLKSLKSDASQTVPSLPANPAVRLDAVVSQLESSAAACDNASQPDDQAKLESEFNELQARKLLAENREAVLAHLDRLKMRHLMDQCIRQTDTTEITRFGNRLMSTALTGALQSALEEELAFFGMNHFRLSLEKKGSKGNTVHQLQIANVSIKKMELSGILSEGEQRVVAIALLLAELRTSGHQCGIIFDDPVSSLDHSWREKVARRLVQLANDRQVIIFTHDMVFLNTLQQEATEQQVPLKPLSLRRRKDQTGICEPELPWGAKNVKARIGYLRDLMQQADKAYRNQENEIYLAMGTRFYGLLREAWERAVEEVALNSAIIRYRPSIETQKLREVVMDGQDYHAIEQGMSKTSQWLAGHDMAPAINAPFPEPAELLKDLADLQSFVTQVHVKREGRKAK